MVGAREGSARLLEALSASGYFCALAEGPQAILAAAAKLEPEVILLSAPAGQATEALELIRSADSLRGIPVLADRTRSKDPGLGELEVDDCFCSLAGVAQRVEAALRARQLVEKENTARLRLEMLLEITQAATSSLDLNHVISTAVEKVGRAVPSDRCSVVLVEGESPRLARVVASRGHHPMAPIALDLARYPELRRALETRQPVHVEDAGRDPLMEEVRTLIAPLGIRSILVQPLICYDDLLGAIFLRLSKGECDFGREEQEFVQAVAAALANSIRNARLHTTLKRKREDLESAYVDRYRELIDANRRLKELNRFKDDLIAVCSHDLRAPLQVLLGHGRLLLDSQLQDAQRGSADAMVRTSKKILDLVENLLERGRGEGARLTLDARSLDIAQLCREAGGELSILAEERGVRLLAEAPESLLVVGDEVKVSQVLQNLITNALQHARAKGEVVVRAQRLSRPDGEAAKVVVQDDGEGIPADQLHLVFDKYHAGEGGTGLGLAICKEFVELHGGEIWAENVPQGGCAMIFTLPLARSPRPASASPLPAASGEQARVLVVEDEPEVAAVMAEIFRSRYRVEVARDGPEGVAKARALRPDLVVMDVFLPKMDGLDAAKALKSSSDTAEIPVILISAHQGVAEKVRALNLGAVDYMSKPFQALELLSRAERALKLGQAERGLPPRSQVGSDPATGLFDRSGILARLEQELARSRRYHRPVTLVVFKPEQPVEEKAPILARLIRQRLRSPDLVGHLGGCTFALVMPEAEAPMAHSALGRLLPELGQAAGASFLFAVLQPHSAEETAEAWLERALGSS